MILLQVLRYWVKIVTIAIIATIGYWGIVAGIKEDNIRKTLSSQSKHIYNSNAFHLSAPRQVLVVVKQEKKWFTKQIITTFCGPW